MSGAFIPNSFQLPNIFVDQYLDDLSGSEIKILLFAYRHIYGWQGRYLQGERGFALSVFENGFSGKFKGVGLSKSTIIRTLQKLKERGIMDVVGIQSDGTNIWSISSLDKSGDDEVASVKMTQGVCQNDTGGSVKMTHNEIPMEKYQLEKETQSGEPDPVSADSETEVQDLDETTSINLDMSNILSLFAEAHKAERKRKEERWNAFWDNIAESLSLSGHNVEIQATKGLIGKIRQKMADNGLEPEDVVLFMRSVYRDRKKKTGKPPEITCYLWNTYYSEWAKSDTGIEPSTVGDDEEYNGMPIWLIKQDYPEIYAEYLQAKEQLYEHQSSA